MHAAVQRVLNHAEFILGEEVADFERAFAEFVRVRGAVGVASGTAALRLALQACGIGRGDAVMTTAHTFFATAEAIAQTGARPVFVDIDPVTYALDPNRVEDAVKRPESQRWQTGGRPIRAIVPVHLYGHPADMAPLLEIARAFDLWVIEDAAQAHGAEYEGRRCGGIGHLGCFSFYPGKNLGACGDAGMVTGNDQQLLETVRRLRDHGRTTKHEHQEIGWAERIDALQAAILKAKLRHLDAWTEARRSHARRYAELLAGAPLLLPTEAAFARHVYHLYVVRWGRRDALLAHLGANGIGAGVHYPIPLHRQPAFLHCGYGDVSLPRTEQVAAEVLSVPMFPELTEDQLVRVADVLKEFFR